MVLAVFIRRVGAVVALLGIGCLLVALVVPFAHVEPSRALPGREGVLSYDYSVLDLLRSADVPGAQTASLTRTLYLLPLLGSCCVAVEALRAWQGSAPARSRLALLLPRLALLLLGIGSALLGRAAVPHVVHVAALGEASLPWLASAGPGASLASLGYIVVVAGGVLLTVGALLHYWTLRRTGRRASATTTG